MILQSQVGSLLQTRENVLQIAANDKTLLLRDTRIMETIFADRANVV